MASVPPDPVPLLVSLKAVDPSEYPYYGTAELEPAMSSATGARGRLGGGGGRVSDPAECEGGRDAAPGRRDFKISAVLKQEPDRITAGAGLGPRVMISQAALARTGLVAPGAA